MNQQEKALSELQNQIEESRKIQENNERRHSAMVRSVTERLENERTMNDQRTNKNASKQNEQKAHKQRE